jgi:hypothetical protein
MHTWARSEAKRQARQTFLRNDYRCLPSMQCSLCASVKVSHGNPRSAADRYPKPLPPSLKVSARA